MSEKCEEREHENAANPDEEVQGHFGRVDLFFVHVLRLAARRRFIHRVGRVEITVPYSDTARRSGWLSLSVLLRYTA
jgi:hypothetical protein